jgi:hypothetical protein
LVLDGDRLVGFLSINDLASAFEVGGREQERPRALPETVRAFDSCVGLTAKHSARLISAHEPPRCSATLGANGRL